MSLAGPSAPAQAENPARVVPALHFVDGDFVHSLGGSQFGTFSPATGERLATVAEGRAEDVSLAVAAARRADQRPPSVAAATPATRRHRRAQTRMVVRRVVVARGDSDQRFRWEQRT